MKKISLNDWKKELLKDIELAEKIEKDEAILDIISVFLNYRKENKLTQKELAIMLETTQQAISRLEKNLINPSLKFLVDSLYKMGYKISVTKIK